MLLENRLLAVLVGTIALASTLAAAQDAGSVSCRAVLAEERIYIGQEGVILRQADLRSDVYEVQEELVEQFAALARTLEAEGVALFLAPVPPRGIALRDYLYLDDPAQATYDGEGVATDYLAWIRAWNAAGVAAIDLFTPLQEFNWNDSTDLPNLANEFHWSVEGSRISAEAVAEGVRTHPSFASVEQRDVELALTRVSGGAVRFIDEIAALCDISIRSDRLTEFEVVPNESLGLFDEPAPPPIVHVGTSYSSSRFSFGPFLSRALGADVLTVQEGGGGLVGSLDYALRSGAIGAETRVVVWEFPFIDLSGVTFGGGSRDEIRSNLNQLDATALGPCRTEDAVLELDRQLDAGSASVAIPLDAGPGDETSSESTYLTLRFEDATIHEFALQVPSGDARETFAVNRTTRYPSEGDYYFDPARDGIPAEIALDFPEPLERASKLSIAVCRRPAGE